MLQYLYAVHRRCLALILHMCILNMGLNYCRACFDSLLCVVLFDLLYLLFKLLMLVLVDCSKSVRYVQNLQIKFLLTSSLKKFAVVVPCA